MISCKLVEASMVECTFMLFSQYHPSQNSPAVPNVKAAESDDFHVIGRCAMGGNGWGEVLCRQYQVPGQTNKAMKGDHAYYNLVGTVGTLKT